ncbi:MAG: glycosyltransferase family 2 protein [Acidobacteriaceae bacterium]
MTLPHDSCVPADGARGYDDAMPSVVVIVLNWNGWKDTVACLEALANIEYANMSAVVVDNGSSDESVARIREAFPQVKLIETGSNLGFAGGVNAGIRDAFSGQSDYVWLLNNDAAPLPAALAALVCKAQSDPRFAEVGSVLIYADRPDVVQAWGGGQVNRWMGRATHATRRHDDGWFDYMTAASVLLRRQSLEEVGLFDESFFLYWEDTDLSIRLRLKNWKLGVAADAFVLHRENGSTGRNRHMVDRFSTTSGIRFLRKHSPVPWLSIPIFLTLRIAKRLLRGSLSGVGAIIGGLSDYNRLADRGRFSKGRG